jgi:branched-chain amino acid transport system substrate-binding protein
LAVQEINAASGINGRQMELITRDIQSDPTKAVNGAAELTRGEKVSVVFGPVNSGESLAVVPLLARTKTLQIHPCWVDSLTDVKKYPLCFRNAPTNQQVGGAANRYVVEVLKKKKVPSSWYGVNCSAIGCCCGWSSLPHHLWSAPIEPSCSR